MTPFQGAGAGQAIEVSLRLFRERNRDNTCDLGCIDPSFVTLKRARNESHSASGAQDLLSHPPTSCHRNLETFAPKRGVLYASFTCWSRPPRPLVLRAPSGNCEADTG